MRKLFYSISIFLFLGLLTLGYYESYRLADMRDRLWLMENSGEGLLADAEDEEKSGILLEDGTPGAAVMASENGDENEYGAFFLKEKEDLVLVCLPDRETVYETTSIHVSSLPETLREEIKSGKFLKDKQELYSFLENYSS